MSWYHYEGNSSDYLRGSLELDGTMNPRTQVELRSKENSKKNEAKAAEIDAWIAKERQKLLSLIGTERVKVLGELRKK